MKKAFKLVHETARRLAVECVANAPAGFVVTVAEPNRSLDQNAKLHAVISDISKQVEWQGERMDVDDWKRLLTAAWARAENEQIRMVKALDGHGFDVLYRRTSTMTKAEMISLIEYIQAWGSDQGVEWSDLQ